MVSFSYEHLVPIRHYVHQHPELSGQEYQTTAYLKAYLEKLGVRILNSGLKTGLIAEIGSGKPVIALRADIDALPIQENTGLDYQSQNPGVMHAMEADLKGTIRLIFQPAEETSEGASAVLATGLLEDVQAILGFHNMPSLPAGQLALRPGAMMAGVEKFKVTVTGVSSHAARPDLGLDTVVAITSMVQQLQTLVSRTVSPFETAVLSVTHIEAGSTWNVLPKSGYFEGTIRTFNPDLQRRLKADFIRVIEQISNSTGVMVQFAWGKTPPVTYNDKALAKKVFRWSKSFAEVVEAQPSTAGEDFAFYQEKIPGVFAFIGSNGAADAPDLHHDSMVIDDAAFAVSVPYYVENALALLEKFSTK